jgi:large subunit ribosomal protein L9
MKLLLQRNVDKVGNIGDIVKVAPGYGRNYLLPRGLAVEVTPDNLNRFESMKRKLIAMEQETKEKFQLIAKELEKTSCTIIANSSEEGHLYGSVTAREIAKQLASDGIEVDTKCVLLDTPIKELGIYKVKIRLHADVECEAKVWVVKGDDSQDAPKKAKSTLETSSEEESPPPEESFEDHPVEDSPRDYESYKDESYKEDSFKDESIKEARRRKKR